MDTARWKSCGFYEQVMQHVYDLEEAWLTMEVGASPFQDAYVAGSDAKENCNRLRIYFAVVEGGVGSVQQRCLDSQKLGHREYQLAALWDGLFLGGRLSC